MSTLAAIKKEVPQEKWKQKLASVVIGGFIVLVGLGVCGVGLWLLVERREVPWYVGCGVGAVGLVIGVAGGIAMDKEIVYGAFKSAISLGSLARKGFKGEEPPANG